MGTNMRGLHETLHFSKDGVKTDADHFKISFFSKIVSHTTIRSTLSALLRSNIFFLEKPVHAGDMKCTKYNDTHQRKWRMVGSGGYWMVMEGIGHYLMMIIFLR